MKNRATFFAIAAAALYAMNVPFSKLLIDKISPTMMAAFLYLGAGVGMVIFCLTANLFGKDSRGEPLTAKELPYTISMIILDIAAPILLMYGISMTSSANVSLLNNFEIAVTSVIAFAIFKETVSKRLLAAICLVTISSILLSFEGNGALSFNVGSLFVIAASICWGFENNCTKMLSNKSSEEIVIIKGIFCGIGSFVTALAVGEKIPKASLVIIVMLLGFAAYGLSINFYIMAQKHLGAAKTSAYYSIAPFLGVLFSFVFVGERPKIQFYAALAIMTASTVLMVKDTVELQHNHEHSHIKNGIAYTHSHLHTHSGNTEDHEHVHKL